MANHIHTESGRKRLKPRNEPYWHKVSTGRYVGLRVTPSREQWTWKARIIEDRKSKATTLGPFAEMTFEEASEAANKWFRQLQAVEDVEYTVRQAVTDYLEDLKVRKGEKAEKITRQRLMKHLSDSLLKTRLVDLKANKIRTFKNDLAKVMSQSGANRTLSAFKAALNLAYKSDLVDTNRAWVTVPPFKNADQARDIFLTDEEVARWLECATGAFRDLSLAAILTGARYGELASARVKDLVGSTISLSGKTGRRTTYLSDAAAKHLHKMAQDKLPEAWLLTQDSGNPWIDKSHTKAVARVKREAKLPAGTVFYCLRHYHISKALLAGVQTQVLAENTGTSVQMIEKHYGKFMREDRVRMMNMVNLA